MLSRRPVSSAENGSSSSIRRRLLGERAGERHALLLAAGELVRAPIQHPRSSPTISLSSRIRASRLPAPAASRPKPMFSATLRCGNSAPSCGTKPIPRRCAGTSDCAVGQHSPAERDAADVRRLESGDQAQQRGLAGAGRADDRRAAAGRHVEVDVDQRQRRSRSAWRCPEAEQASSPDGPPRLHSEQQGQGQRREHHRYRVGRRGGVVESRGVATRTRSRAYACRWAPASGWRSARW